MKAQFESYIALCNGIAKEVDEYESENLVRCKFSLNNFSVTVIAESSCTFGEFKALTCDAINRQVSDLAYNFGVASKRRDEIVKNLGLKPVKRSFWRLFL